MKERKNLAFIIRVLAGCIIVGCVLAGVIRLTGARHSDPAVPDGEEQNKGSIVAFDEKEQNEGDEIASLENGQNEEDRKVLDEKEQNDENIAANEKEEMEPYEISMNWGELEFLPEPLTFTEESPEFKAEEVLWERSGAECFTGEEAEGVERVILWQNASEISLTFVLSEKNGYQTLSLPELPESYKLEQIEVLGYREICGNSGYRVDYPVEAGTISRAYYGFRDRKLEPVLQGYNGVFEVDYDEDGQTEVISCYEDRTQSWVYDEQDGVVRQCNVNRLLERSILERTGTTRESMVYYMKEANHFAYMVLPEKLPSGEETESERGMLELTMPSLLRKTPL